MKNYALMLMLLFGMTACKKGNGPTVALTGKLTDCPANSICGYNYYNNADFSTSNVVPYPGQYRVFDYSSVNDQVCDLTTSLLFKAPEDQESFDITSNQIAKGQIIGNYLVCPCCNYAILVRPIGGEIKGKKTDNTHWLINATVIFGTALTAPTDTLMVNQYFTVKSLQ